MSIRTKKSNESAEIRLTAQNIPIGYFRIYETNYFISSDKKVFKNIYSREIITNEYGEDAIMGVCMKEIVLHGKKVFLHFNGKRKIYSIDQLYYKFVKGIDEDVKNIKRTESDKFVRNKQTKIKAKNAHYVEGDIEIVNGVTYINGRRMED